MRLATVKAAILDNPYIPLCTPPVLVVIQFILIVSILGGGVPDYMIKARMTSIPLTGAFFGVCAFSVPATFIGIRGVIYGKNKLAPALGIALNVAYLISFIVFFIMLIVLKVAS